jgi:hypothetical protein
VPADQRQRVASARVGDRHAGVAGHADGRGNARDDFEGHSLFVQEEGLFATAVEHERVAPLQPRDDAALARLLGEEVADGFLCERLGRGGAHVDPLGMSRRVTEQAGMHEVVVQHHVGSRETLQPARGDETGVARSGANDVDDRTYAHLGGSCSRRAGVEQGESGRQFVVGP